MSTTTTSLPISSTISSIATSTSDVFLLYRYEPTMGASALFAALFGLNVIVMILLLIKITNASKVKISSWSSITEAKGLRYFPADKLAGAYIPMVVGTAVEVGGYIARCVSSNNKSEVGPYAAQSVLLLISPTLFAASIYMLFGRMATLLFAEKIMIMPARFNTTIFVTGDIFSLLLQAAGGGLMASASSTDVGSDICVAGLFLQIGFFGLFIINEFVFYFRVYKVDSEVPRRCSSWKWLNIIMLGGSFLILIRSIVRAIEFIEGFKGFIISHEWFLYVFDALPMFAFTLLFTLIMPWYNIFVVQYESVDIQVYGQLSESKNSDSDIERYSENNINTNENFYPDNQYK